MDDITQMIWKIQEKSSAITAAHPNLTEVWMAVNDITTTLMMINTQLEQLKAFGGNRLDRK